MQFLLITLSPLSYLMKSPPVVMKKQILWIEEMPRAAPSVATGKNREQMNPRSSPIESKSVTFTRVLRVLGALHVIIAPSYSPSSCCWKTVDKTWIHHSRRSSVSPFRRSRCFPEEASGLLSQKLKILQRVWLGLGWDHRCSSKWKP